MHSDLPRIPVFLLSGFLGSGKTTLLNRVLKAPEFAMTAVVVNEFGEIGLDHLLVARGRDNVVLLEAGCLCCTIADSLHETLADLYAGRVRGDVPRFTRVIVETTGLADPAPLLNTLLGHRLVTDHYRLEQAVVTVDAQHAMTALDAHPEVAQQIAVADRLIITKRDLVGSESGLDARLVRLNPSAIVIDARDANAPLAAFAPGERHRVTRWTAQPAGGQGRSRHDAGIRAESYVLGKDVSWAGIAAWWRLASESFGGRLLRCKGIVRIRDTGEVVFLQAVSQVFHSPERLSAWPDADHRSRLVCITRAVDPADLRATLVALEVEAEADPGAFVPPSHQRNES
jgi:G3E family GTPase